MAMSEKYFCPMRVNTTMRPPALKLPNVRHWLFVIRWHLGIFPIPLSGSHVTCSRAVIRSLRPDPKFLLRKEATADERSLFAAAISDILRPLHAHLWAY